MTVSALCDTGQNIKLPSMEMQWKQTTFFRNLMYFNIFIVDDYLFPSFFRQSRRKLRIEHQTSVQNFNFLQKCGPVPSVSINRNSIFHPV